MLGLNTPFRSLEFRSSAFAAKQEENVEGCPRSALGGERSYITFSPNSIGQNVVTRPHPTAREGRKWGLPIRMRIERGFILLTTNQSISWVLHLPLYFQPQPHSYTECPLSKYLLNEQMNDTRYCVVFIITFVRLRIAKWLADGHPTSKWPSQDSGLVFHCPMLPPKISICVLSPELCGKMKSIRASPWPGGVYIKREKLKSSPSLPWFKDQLRTKMEWNGTHFHAKCTAQMESREMHSGVNPVVWEILRDKAELKHQEKLCAHKFSQGHLGFRLWSISMLHWIQQQAIWALGVSLTAHLPHYLSWAEILKTVLVCMREKQFKLALTR